MPSQSQRSHLPHQSPQRQVYGFCPPRSDNFTSAKQPALSLVGGHTEHPLLPHVNMPAKVFVASNARCPRELIRRVVCWRLLGRGFAVGSGLGDAQRE